ncbi:hypothetical protein Nepgr_024996 [Nepenthes gracilis]|uniref:Uncharacterized protein n=1 Tax=Nepenthes gracilis TaxID=150966 RepID=A0AAD3T5D9_NEPGR|nr:hypothetical protein Nepgr_024996 [Nepenthes gracilis]
MKQRKSVPPSVEISKVVRKPHRRSSIAVVANGHHHPTSAPPKISSLSGIGFELVSRGSPTYISLKDLLPSSSSILSPKATAATSSSTASSGSGASLSGYEISIRNRLVKQAAWAYLQPMSSSPSSSSGRLCSLYSGYFFDPLLASVRRWIVDALARVFSCLVDALWFILAR